MMFLGGSSASRAASAPAEKKPDKNDPLVLGKEWKRNLQKEIRKMDRDILNIKRQEEKSIRECKALAKQNRMSAVKILAKEIANTRRAVERMYVAKAQLNSVANNLQTSMSMIKLQGVIAKSGEIMAAMNKLVNIAEISETMTAMAREMERAGLVDEIIGDAMASMDEEGIDAEADKEVDRIVAELTAGVLAPAGSAPAKSVPSKATATAAPAAEEPAVEDASTQELLSRLQAL